VPRNNGESIAGRKFADNFYNLINAII
jgi:hypothetical protein